MSKRLYNFIAALVTAISGAAIATVTFIGPEHAAAINASIPIAEGAIIAILSNFKKDE